MRIVSLLFCAAVCWGQSLQILPGPPSGSNLSFRMMLVSPAGKAPLGLQWRMDSPDGAAITGIVVSEAASTAGKELTCVAVPSPRYGRKRPDHACILVGGEDALPDGAVAVVTLELRSGVRQTTIRVHSIVGVSADLKEIVLADTEAVIAAQ